MVDPRFELLAVVHLLAGGQDEDGFAWDGSVYARDVREAFAPHAKHPAVAAYRRLRRGGLNAVEAQRVVSRLGPLPKLEAPPGPSDERALLKALQSFAADSRFAEFFEAHRPLYDEYAAEVSSALARLDYPAMLEDYTGLRVSARYTIVLCPLRDSRSNFNDVQCAPAPSGHRVLSAVGASGVEGGRHRFDLAARRWDVWHELGHTLLDRRLHEHAAAVAATARLAGRDPSACYGDWASCLREHVVQGLAFRVLAWAHANGRAPEPVWSPAVKAGKLPHIEAVVARLAEYEARRSEYPTLARYYPRLLDVFVEKAGPASAASGPPPPVPRAKSECGGEERAPSPEASKPGPALAKFLRGDLEGARRDLAAAAARDPLDAMTRLSLAVALDALGRPAEALASADEAVRLALMGRDSDGVPAAEALSTRASIRRRGGKAELAAGDLRRALEVAPEEWPRRAEVEAALTAAGGVK